MRKGHLVTLALLGTMAACGGGSGAVTQSAPTNPSLGLTYSAPPETEWHLAGVGGCGTLLDPLILELRGPSGARVKGVAFTLDLGVSARAAWIKLGATTLHTPTPNVDLGSDPRLSWERLVSGELQVGLFQKSGDADPSHGIVRLAVSATPGASPGDVVLLQDSLKAAVLYPDGTFLTPLPIAIGALKIQ